MSSYSKCVASASVGATANTFDALGTWTLRNDAKGTLGIWVEAAPVTAEAAVAYHGQIRVTSADLGIGGQIASCPPYEGGSPATNIGFRCYNTEFIPFAWGAKGKEQISIEFSSQLPDPTNACSVVAALIFEAGSVGSTIDNLNDIPFLNPFGTRGWNCLSKATITTVAETDMGADQPIPGWASEIVGFKAYMLPNLMTAGEEVVGYMRVRSSMPDFDPCEIPFAFGVGAPLGTPVGKGLEAQSPHPVAYSFKKKANINESIRGYVVLNAAITTGHPASLTVYYR